jgi:competence protein ComEC
VVLEVDGERFEAWVRGPVRRRRVEEWRAGDRVVVSGSRRSLRPERRARVAWQHIVGGIDVDWFGDHRSGGRAAEASNRVRAVIARGASALPPDRAALTRGLVIGDDRDEPPDMVERFRIAGLSHLTAVSGQNVALLLAAAGPLLRRARAPARWAVTIGLIGWFVVLTRAEPSVMRAGAMAALAATGFALGRQAEPLRLLAVAVIGLLLLDPLLAWSVGFWLSVGATAGVTLGAVLLAPHVRALGPLAVPVAVTIGAQAGVAIPSLLVFGRLSLVGTVANLVAVPVAGLVMLYGLPACLVAGALPPIAPVVMLPVGLGVWWVDAVATVGARVEPTPPWSWLGWAAVLGVLVALVRASRRRPAR